MPKSSKAAIGAGIAVAGVAIASAAYLALKQPPPPTTVLDATTILDDINAGASTNVPAGMYTLPSDFAGFQLGQFSQQLTFDAQTRFIYPLGYAGPIFHFTDAKENAANVTIIGGQYWEAGPYTGWQRKATGILMESSTSAGILENFCQGLWFNDLNIGIDLQVTVPTGFINNNTFQQIVINHPQTAGVRETFASSLNSYENFTVEMGVLYTGPSAVGFIIDGFRNYHTNDSVEDCEGTQSTGVVNSTAESCYIQGGNIAAQTRSTS